MKIYSVKGKGWYHGLGDVVCFAWLGEGIKESGGVCEFFATDWHAEVLRMFRQKITDDETGARYTDMGYETAVKIKSPMNYIEWIAHHLGIDAKPVRPKLDVDPMDREMGRRAAGDVLVFPHGIWTPRVWPKNYFVELGLMLRDAGYKIRYVMKERDYAFFMPFPCIVGKSLSFIASAIQASSLVIGNDSGPAHLAGTIGTPTIAIHGPTQRDRIYGHLPEVIGIENGALACAGCHCLPPQDGGGWRDSCGSGCFQLYRTFPEEVFAKAVSIIGKPKRAYSEIEMRVAA